MANRQKTRILLVEDHPIYREGLHSALTFSKLNCEVIAEAANVQQAIDYIEKHYPEADLSVGKLAESLGVSDGHLSRLFKSETDMGINNYLPRYRIRKAMDYLKDVQIKVYEVAEKVGYQDIAYFSNTFKKLTGRTPSDYQLKGLG